MLRSEARIPVFNVSLMVGILPISIAIPYCLPVDMRGSWGLAFSVVLPTVLLFCLTLRESHRLQSAVAHGASNVEETRDVKYFYFWTLLAWLPIPIFSLLMIIAVATGTYDPVRDDSFQPERMLGWWIANLAQIAIAATTCVLLLNQFLRGSRNLSQRVPIYNVISWALQFPAMLLFAI
ncbi:hypothetical protein Pan258_38520 [Symmachiella dynata]|uniref:hypothetical protein n=1 Tax=Symmachiella dynata TaxID=2527995 RepID=UPI00118A6CDD|nr:hypothetical protein [Symmachiella dynata]QDT49797.1 hypothetical protein Pan258_38520 [Symmachiella dynata]